jgi:RHS repeat-associated protein
MLALGNPNPPIIGYAGAGDPYLVPLDEMLDAPAVSASYYIHDHLGNTRIVYHYSCDEIATTHGYTLEHVMDYYPYGKMLQEYKYGTALSERYLTTHHERDVESGLDYRGARFYDSDIGRFLSLDPMAVDYPAWSDYNYVLGNPVMYVDPDGKKADNIIIEGDTKTEQEALLSKVQALTNDELAINPETNEVYVVKSGNKNRGKNLKEGSALIKRIIGDDNTTTIHATIRGTGTNPYKNGKKIDPKDAKLGIEYDSRIGFQLDRAVPTTNADGTIGGVPNFISMSHELGHADSNGSGTNDRTEYAGYDFDGKKVIQFTSEEIKSRFSENRIRQEHRIKPRATPIIFSFFTKIRP